jgi:hypothetical protein
MGVPHQETLGKLKIFCDVQQRLTFTPLLRGNFSSQIKGKVTDAGQLCVFAPEKRADRFLTNRHLERSNLRRSFYDVQQNIHYFLFQVFSSTETRGDAQDSWKGAVWVHTLGAGESFKLLIITDISTPPHRGDLYDVQQNIHNYLFWPLASNRNIPSGAAIAVTCR